MKISNKLLILFFYTISLCLMAFLPHFQAGQPTVTATATKAISVTVTPQLPKVIKSLYYGVSPVNSGQPNLLAMDNRTHRLYISTRHDDEGAIAVLNTQTGQFEQVINRGGGSDFQIDPTRQRLYISSYDNSWAVDIRTMTTTQVFSGVETMTFDQDKIYTASEKQITILNADTFTALVSQPRLDSPNSILYKMYVNSPNHRLYLVVNNAIEIYATDTLTLVNTYPLSFENNFTFLPQSQQLMVYQGDNRMAFLDADGHEVKTMTLTIPKIDYYKVVAVTDNYFYLVTAQIDSYRLHGYQLHQFKQQDISLVKSFSLPHEVKNFAIDAAEEFGYGGYFEPNYYYQSADNDHLVKVDLATGQVQFIYTQLSIVDLVIDEASERLYTLNEQGTVRVLDRATQQELAKVETGSFQNVTKSVTSRLLSLDNKRQRLYVSGNQLRIVDTQALTVVQRLPITGQVVANPLSDQIYVVNGNCGVQVIEVDSWQQKGIFYPHGATTPPPPMGPCIGWLKFDVKNQMLHAMGGVCAGGSSCGGSMTDIFDVSTSPPRYITTVSGSTSTFDSAQNHFFVFGDNYEDWIMVYGVTSERNITITTQITGRRGWHEAVYDPFYQQLHTNHAIYNLDLVLLGHSVYSGTLRTIDPKYQLLYATDKAGYLYVLTTTGGTLSMPLPTTTSSGYDYIGPTIAANQGTQFRIYNYRLYRSDNGGQSWQLLGYGLPNDNVRTFAISPNYAQDQTLLVATGSKGNGLYHSTDGGETWQPMMRGLSYFKIQTINFSPTYSQDHTLFLDMERALFRSTDGGENWQDLGVDSLTHDLTFSPNFAADRLLFLHAANDLLHSVDGGLTWQPVMIPTWSDVWGLQFYFSPTFTQDKTIYLIVEGICCNSRYSILRLQDQGEAFTWEFAQFSLPPEFAPAKLQASFKKLQFLPNGDIQLTNDQENTYILALDQLTWAKDPLPTPTPN